MFSHASTYIVCKEGASSFFQLEIITCFFIDHSLSFSLFAEPYDISQENASLTRIELAKGPNLLRNLIFCFLYVLVSWSEFDLIFS